LESVHVSPSTSTTALHSFSTTPVVAQISVGASENSSHVRQRTLRPSIGWNRAPPSTLTSTAVSLWQGK
jgi:hypothetical protein